MAASASLGTGQMQSVRIIAQIRLMYSENFSAMAS
jgi:hypothetical protein